MVDPSLTMTRDVLLAFITTWMNKGLLWAFLSNGRSLSKKEILLLDFGSSEAIISLGVVSEGIFAASKVRAKASGVSSMSSGGPQY